MRIICILPFVMLVRLVARHDPHLFRYRDVKSLHQWRRCRVIWLAYAISLVGWAVVFVGMYLLIRWFF
ncbi:MAG: hypothetical protein ABSF38_01380 [Verrucomicrobiota bacterium]|jgi:hypothetical protein